MDSETGESLRDKETGEMPPLAKVNIETGEAEINVIGPHELFGFGRRFKIPNENLNCNLESSSGSDVKMKKVNPLDSSDFVPVIVFLLPTILFFNRVIGVGLCILEICLHVWAHKKNKKLCGKGIYYQSPLHIIMREFCAACREERTLSKITRIQDKRNYKFIKYGIDYVHGIVM